MHIGKYQLLRKLATGGMAEVFLAKASGPMGFEKTLVVKRILSHLAEDPAFTAMFLSEAKLAAQLNHPNIVQIFDFGEADGSYYLAMEYIDGPNLRTLSKSANKLGLELAPALCARIIANACEGLAFAHDYSDPVTGQPLGLVHRDISPDNLLLSRQGSVKVVDFGIAKAAGQNHHTQTGVIKGKLSYMPPEQLRKQPLDQRTDVYALGIVLYELLTGHKPFDAKEDANIMRAILFEPPVPAVERRPDLPKALCRILDRALAKHRQQRYPSCRGFQADLEQFILDSGTPVSSYQLAQLVLQLTASTDTPAKTPASGSPSHGSIVELSALEEEIQAEPLPPTVLTATAVSWRPRTASVIGAALLLLIAGGLLYSRTSTVPTEPEPAAASTLPNPAPGVTHPTEPEPELLPAVESELLPAVEPEARQVDEALAAIPPPESAPAFAPATPTQAVEAPQPGSREIHHGRERRRSAPKPPRKSSPSSTEDMSKGTIQVRFEPYTTVILDGKEVEQTPPLEAFEVPAGKHTVTLVKEGPGEKETQVIQVNEDDERIIKLNPLKE